MRDTEDSPWIRRLGVLSKEQGARTWLWLQRVANASLPAGHRQNEHWIAAGIVDHRRVHRCRAEFNRRSDRDLTSFGAHEIDGRPIHLAV